MRVVEPVKVIPDADHAAVMVGQFPLEPDFFDLPLTVGVDDASETATGVVGTGCKDLVFVDNRRADVGCAAVRTGIAPKQRAVPYIQAEYSLRGELHEGPNPRDAGDHGGTVMDRLSDLVRTPSLFAGAFVQGQDAATGAARCDQEQVAIDQGRFAIAAARMPPCEIVLKIRRPERASGG